ncbi:WXG100 family type VII secretion target [Herpetosiphon llansteffanensis]|uniref:WXG100 family type VII secretion target n=1 Tax=Herpetosiphon llansteffanensis TaxID=2094568 RepID=UPI000D7C5E9D|nr:WXG100 family type VII secretion target [Herpetosiphon llansteffanensis]
MPAPFVQIKYEAVDTIIQRFQNLHDQSQSIQATLCQTIATLQAGQWQGQAADSCFQEFTHEVKPAFQRLLQVLQSSVETTKAIRQTMAAAEAEAAALFRDDFATIGLGSNKLLFSQENGEKPTQSEPPLKLPFIQQFIERAMQLFAEWHENFGSKVNPHPDGSVSEAEAAIIFNDMANEADIPFQFPDDGCYARAHVMAYRISERYGIDINNVDKVFIDGDLEAETKFIYKQITLPDGSTYPSSTTDGTVNWYWHVAPIIYVRQENATVPMVIDPSLAERPLTIEQWKAIMTDPHAVTKITDHNIYKPGSLPYEEVEREGFDKRAHSILDI